MGGVLLVLFLIALVVFALLIGLIGGLLQLIVMLIIAGVVGWLADLVVPGQLPFGWLGAIAAGLIGGWIGHLLIGSFGPTIAGINLIPAFIGAVILAALVEIIGKALGSRTTA
ncbi:MAG: GlsB/YeaQ/YmgE family stress response membrane protein [Chloroflexota bacterium]|nr:MAG: GlsB/YeaQ/YmgE family stress response membrane protein [Chloroflexota bacterium]